MGKLSIKQGKQLIEQGLLTQEAYDAMVEGGIISEGRTAGGVKRVIAGTEISPQLYFKGGKGVDVSDEVKAVMVELRGLVNDLFEQYTVIAD